VAAAEFDALRNLHKSGFDYPDASAMYRAYAEDLFQFDQRYRHFCESADVAEEKGWNVVNGAINVGLRTALPTDCGKRLPHA